MHPTGQLTTLRDLRLAGNRLKEVPDAIARLSKLQKLYLTANRLTALPSSIGALSNLEVLYCGGNLLETLPDTIGLLSKLSMLYLGGNKLVELPDTMMSLYRLRTLNVHDNQLSYLCVPSFLLLGASAFLPHPFFPRKKKPPSLLGKYCCTGVQPPRVLLATPEDSRIFRSAVCAASPEETRCGVAVVVLSFCPTLTRTAMMTSSVW